MGLKMENIDTVPYWKRQHSAMKNVAVYAAVFAFAAGFIVARVNNSPQLLINKAFDENKAFQKATGQTATQKDSSAHLKYLP